MRKTVKFESEEIVTICDICGDEDPYGFPQCEICEKDICLKHKIYDVSIHQKGTILDDNLEHRNIVICGSCLDKVSLKDLRGK